MDLFTFIELYQKRLASYLAIHLDTCSVEEIKQLIIDFEDEPSKEDVYDMVLIEKNYNSACLNSEKSERLLASSHIFDKDVSRTNYISIQYYPTPQHTIIGL